VCRVCDYYLADLSAERQAAARQPFAGTLQPGRSWVRDYLPRHPELPRYRLGTLEEGRARNGHPDVVANWFSLVTLLYRNSRVTSSRQVCNEHETHVHARMSAMDGRRGILGGVGMRQPDIMLPTFALGGRVHGSLLRVCGGRRGTAFRCRRGLGRGSRFCDGDRGGRVKDQASIVILSQ